MSFRGEHPFSGMPPNKSIRGLVDSYYLKTHYLKFAHKITRILPRMQIIFLKKPYVPPKWRNLSFQIRVCPLFQIRFEGDDFMIELTRDELSRCQIGTLNIKRGQNINSTPSALHLQNSKPSHLRRIPASPSASYNQKTMTIRNR